VASIVSRRMMTAAMIDSRDFLAGRRRAETAPLLAAGVRIAFGGGVIVFRGSGVTDNPADKAKRLGIPLFDVRKGGG